MLVFKRVTNRWTWFNSAFTELTCRPWGNGLHTLCTLQIVLPPYVIITSTPPTSCSPTHNSVPHPSQPHNHPSPAVHANPQGKRFKLHSRQSPVRRASQAAELAICTLYES